MTAGRDDDALGWGDDDPTLDVEGVRANAKPAPVAAEPAPPSALPDGFSAVGKGSETVGRVDPAAVATAPETDAEPRQIGNGTLIALGVFGGVYLLYAIGWLIGGLRLQGDALFVVSPAMYQPALVLAVLSPVIWFAAAYLLTRGSRAWLRIVWLLAGVLLLVPWPFIMVGAVGR